MGATDSIALNRILTQAAGFRASDLHLVIGTQPTVRLDGKLVTLDTEPIVTADFQNSSVATLLNDEQRERLTKEKEVVTAVTVNAQLRFKLTAFYQRGNISLSMHFISAGAKKLTELGLPEVITSFVTLPRGLVLVTGPYGSGKSSTLTAFVNEMNNVRSANIVTIESPIEYLYVNNKSIVEQREVGRDAISFEQAIVAATKEDVDVIVISDADSPTVMKAMLSAADAGRFVISTMSADSPVATIDSILNSVPVTEMPKIRTQLASSLAGIISQRLIPRVGGGLVLVADILIPTPPVRSIIRDGALVQLMNAMQTARTPGVLSYDRQLAQLAKQGTISPDDAIVNAQDPASMRSVVGQTS